MSAKYTSITPFNYHNQKGVDINAHSSCQRAMQNNCSRFEFENY